STGPIRRISMGKLEAFGVCISLLILWPTMAVAASDYLVCVAQDSVLCDKATDKFISCPESGYKLPKNRIARLICGTRPHRFVFLSDRHHRLCGITMIRVTCE